MSRPAYLYHYTDYNTLPLIHQSQFIKKSVKGQTGDAIFGDGVYLTQISPFNSTDTIVKNNWDDNTTMQKAARIKTSGVIMIPTAAIPQVVKKGEKSGRDIWVYPERDLYLRGIGAHYLYRQI